jgi:hypothetical protein
MNLRSPSIVTRVTKTTQLTPRDWDEIWLLTSEFYDVERDYAERELRRRQDIATFHMGDALIGMAVIDTCLTTFRGRNIVVLHTSHLLLREPWRGRNLVQKLGARTFLAARLRYPLRPIYWFYDALSYKSYLLLPRNFRTFWPRFDSPTPEPQAALINHLATQAFGPAWRPARGVVVRSGLRRLRPTTAPLILDSDSEPALSFFARANPGHASGDTLVCLCPLTASNWLSLARKAFHRFQRHREIH